MDPKAIVAARDLTADQLAILLVDRIASGQVQSLGAERIMALRSALRLVLDRRLSSPVTMV